MFSLDVIDTDVFLEIPQSSQNLYFHLALRADDDGFVSSPKKIMKMANCGEDDIKVLIAKGYIIPFETGVCVVRHWRIHNYIQKDRYKETMYKAEKEKLTELDGVYGMDTNCIQDVSEMETQVRLGKERLGKVRSGKDKKPCVDFVSTTESESNMLVGADALFEYLWSLYPKKEGKGQVSKSQKEKLQKIGMAEMQRCVERYKSDKEGTEQKYLKMGSTFFNSGYIDYLDENYQKPEPTGVTNILKEIYYGLEEEE